MASVSRRSISAETEFFSAPRCGIKRRRDKQRWYAWLRSIKSIEDLLRPGFPIYWSILTRTQKARLRWYVQKYRGPSKWEELKLWLKDYRRNTRVKKELLYAVEHEDFMLAVNEQLGSHASVVVVAPQEGLNSVILCLAKGGWPPEEMARLMGVDTGYVKRIATPRAVAAFDAENIESKLQNIVRLGALARLLTQTKSGKLSISQLLSILRLCTRLEKRR